jgi:acyl dehydratase
MTVTGGRTSSFEGESLVDLNAREKVGTRTARTRGTAIKKEFQRFAAAVKDANPLYFDEVHARANGYRDVIAPPMYVQFMVSGVANLDELKVDGSPKSGLPLLSKCQRLMAGGKEFSFFEPIYDGDSVVASTVLVSLEEKQGKSGRFVVITEKITYVRDDEVVVAEQVRHTIARP